MACRIFVFVSVLALVCGSTACLPSGGGGGGGNGTDSGGPDATPLSDSGTSTSSITLRGTVKSATGSILPGATLTWKTGSGAPTSATTDATGNFTMTAALPTSAASTAFTVKMSNYAPQVVTVPLKSAVTIYTLPVTLTQLQVRGINPGQTTTFQFGLPGPDNATNSATLTIPPGLPAGTSVRVAPIQIQNSPGVMRAQGDPPSKALASLGMFYVDFVDANGNPVTPPAGVQVNLGAQTPPTIPQADPFNAWTLNAQGYWDNPTPMNPPTGSSPSQPAPVHQFGYWNSDHAFRTACIKGTVKAPSGTCGGARLDLTGPDMIHSVDSSGADGSFCLVGPQGNSGTLSIGNTITFPGSAGDCSVPSSCIDVGSYNISDTQCQNAGGTTDAGPGDAGAEAGDNCDGGDPACMSSCCIYNNGCPGETGSFCPGSGPHGDCCCCPYGQACCANPTQGCCPAP